MEIIIVLDYIFNLIFSKPRYSITWRRVGFLMWITGAGSENFAIATSFGHILALATILLYSRPEKGTIIRKRLLNMKAMSVFWNKVLRKKIAVHIFINILFPTLDYIREWQLKWQHMEVGYKSTSTFYHDTESSWHGLACACPTQ